MKLTNARIELTLNHDGRNEHVHFEFQSDGMLRPTLSYERLENEVRAIAEAIRTSIMHRFRDAPALELTDRPTILERTALDGRVLERVVKETGERLPPQRTYHGERVNGTAIVSIKCDGRHRLDPRLDLRNHSPTGPEWGYGGSGPAQLALALVADATGDDDLALEYYHTFKEQVIARMDRDAPWHMTVEFVREHVKSYGLQADNS